MLAVSSWILDDSRSLDQDLDTSNRPPLHVIKHMYCRCFGACFQLGSCKRVPFVSCIPFRSGPWGVQGNWRAASGDSCSARQAWIAKGCVVCQAWITPFWLQRGCILWKSLLRRAPKTCLGWFFGLLTLVENAPGRHCPKITPGFVQLLWHFWPPLPGTSSALEFCLGKRAFGFL